MSEFTELFDVNYAEKLKETPAALIDFYASWCGSCRMAAPMFKRVASELSLPIFKIDAEKNTEARGLVEIENLPTVAIWKDGKILGSLCTTKEEGLKEFLKSHGF
ncbi:MAG: thioredoxin family protein [Bdellovibrionota bacterium]